MRLLTDEQRARLAPCLPRSAGKAGRPFADHRRIIEGIIYRYRTGILESTVHAAPSCRFDTRLDDVSGGTPTLWRCRQADGGHVDAPVINSVLGGVLAVVTVAHGRQGLHRPVPGRRPAVLRPVRHRPLSGREPSGAGSTWRAADGARRARPS